MIGLNRGQNGLMNFLNEERRAIKTKKKKTRFKGAALALTFLGVSSLTPAGVIDFSELLPKAYAEAMSIDIGTVDELRAFAQGVNNDTTGYRTANVKLTESIVWSNMIVNDDGTVTNAPEANNWEPIRWFEGTFDGNGNTISGIYCVDSTHGDIGFFGNIGDRYGVGYVGATVKNLTLQNSFILGTGSVGAIAGRGRIKEMYNVKTESTVVVGLGDSVGGIIGNLDPSGPKFENVTNGAYVIGRRNVGGCFGQYGTYTGGALTGLKNTGKVEGIAKVGGILGWASGGTKIERCTNTGEIIGHGTAIEVRVGGSEYTIQANTWEAWGSYGGNIHGYGQVKPQRDPGIGIGGIAGYAENGIYELAVGGGCVSECENGGAVSGVRGVGGIFGMTDSSRATFDIRDCGNSGEINGSTNIGGIMGATLRDGSVTKCANSGRVYGSNNIGGIIGSGSCSESTNNEDIGVNAEDQNVEGENVGGIVGSGSCNDGNNEGNVYGKKSVGGIVGSGSCNNSNNKGSVTATGDNAGGIVGSGSCNNSNNDAAGKVVQGANNVGGLIGNGSGKIDLNGCRSTIDVKGSGNNIGGLVGCFKGNSLVTGDSLFKGSVTATGSAATTIGGVAGYLEGNFDFNKNIFDADATVTATNATNVGGLVGEMKGDTNIGVLGIKTVTGDANVGGLFGDVSGGTHKVILNSSDVETLNITGNTIVGGLFGNVAGGEISVIDSRIAGDVKVASGGSGDAIGGILGYLGAGSKATFDKIYSEIVVSGSTATSVGGFIGEVAGGDVFIRNGINMKTVTGKINAAGFIGKIASGTAKLENNINIGAVTGTTPGGIIGLIDGSPNVTIENTLNNDDTSGKLICSGSATTAIHNYQKGENVYTCVNNGGVGECINANFNSGDVLAKCVIEMNRCKNSYVNSLDNISWVTRSEREKRDKWLEWATTSLDGNEIPIFGVTDNLKFVINWKARNVAMADQVLGLLDGAQDAKEISNLGFGFTLKNNEEIVSPDAYGVKLIEKGNSESEKAYTYFINVVRSLDKPMAYTAYIDETQGIPVGGNNKAYNIKQGGTY